MNLLCKLFNHIPQDEGHISLSDYSILCPCKRCKVWLKCTVPPGGMCEFKDLTVEKVLSSWYVEKIKKGVENELWKKDDSRNLRK